ncbi:MAG: phosphoribosylformylglycinamidine synthase subunit PurL [Candidatus Omnitrophica bacterium]|nr:phosphoribosylformylglycinamidine synthase subunit PurL [Candidatus Omnitrophota bacterium]
MLWQIEVKDKPGIFDAVGEGIKKDILDLGIETVEDVSFIQVYMIEGDIRQEAVKIICEELLADNVAQVYRLKPEIVNEENGHTLEVAYNPGVMDPVEESALKAIRDIGIEGVSSVKTAKKYLIKGKITKAQLNTISEKLLYNKLIQHIVRAPEQQSVGAPANYNFKLTKIDLLSASDKELMEISKEGQLFLNLAEMRQIRNYFKQLKRNPTDCELETIAQTWSEHCVHKTFRGRIEYTEKIKNKPQPPNPKPQTRIINNLLKSTIMKATKELRKPWCVSVFHDNSGIIRFDDKYNVCFKVETHNHPSALEPFGGANTGVGGVIRDILGTGLGAKPIANTDVFCFGPPDYPFSRLPPGTLHPKRVAKGVVSGVRDYGNKMGIPTVNGAVLFDEGFVCNPLVYCGTLGIIPQEKSFKKVEAADLIVVVGGRTGRDGIHGATFSSGELTHESEKISSGAVQIGNPISEKKMLDTLIQARDENLYRAVTDCGAGGLSSAIGEMGADLGAKVALEKVPLKYQGLSYTEIWISESQERMVLAVPKENIERLLKVFSDEDVEATVIGEFTKTKRLELFYKDNLVCDIDMDFLHNGLPQITKKAVWVSPKFKEPNIKIPRDLTPNLKKILRHYNVCSKEWIIRQYDHEVQGGAVIKPLVGIDNAGPSDAAVVQPLLDSKKGVIVSCGINFRFGLIDPYWMAASCIDEALRQIVAVGGSLNEVALLDNFCWGNPDKPDRLGGLVRAAYACYDMSKAFGVPFVSGKDSLNNEYKIKGKSIAIPGTLLISAFGVIQDVSKAISMDLKNPKDLIYIVGMTYDELGGSHYFDTLGFIGNSVPKVNPRQAKKTFSRLSLAVNKGLIKAMHDCSEGGLGVALAEMSFAGGIGMDIFLAEVPYQAQNLKRKAQNARNDFILFSESNSRFLVEVERKKQKEFENALKGVPLGLIGCASEKKEFRVFGLDNRLCVNCPIQDLKEAWQAPLRW